MSLIRIRGGTIYDPANGIDGEVRELAWTGTCCTAGGGHAQHELLAGEGFVAEDFRLLEQDSIAVWSFHQSSSAAR